METITCFVVDDEKEACLRLQDIIKKFRELNFIGYERDADTAILSIIQKKPDLVFLDVEMPGKNGFEVLEAVRSNNLFPTFIFVTAYIHYAINAIREKAFDYLLKPVDIGEFKEAIERYKERNQTSLNFDHTSLTEREKQVARLLCQGKTSKEIAKHLYISANTVNTHRKAILKKLGFSSTSELLSALSGFN
ncbi:MAG: response regulator transcription factor [Bacteroidales bacterium]|nr:response regulator transcription factor [Bacteroidales bacterium]